MSPRLVPVLVAAGLALVAAACASGGEPALGPTIPPADDAGPPVVFVALGGDETLGQGLDDQLRQSWPQVLLRDGLPRRAVHVNLASPGATAAQARAAQVPAALEVDPTLATVWLGGGDARVGTSPAAYRRGLDAVVAPLAEAGARVLVVLGPAAAGAGYDGATAGVVEGRGATLVDLRTLDPALDAAAHRQVATAVAEAAAG
ncbi:MAG TPA: SGNH/GDSL hydrolase family protein [Acidimicrobiales bacterium]|nr:SGNH/GDSL hydrolase family protein [Acidimicrobiales bacterium]